MYLSIFKGKDYPLVPALKEKAWLLAEPKPVSQQAFKRAEMLLPFLNHQTASANLKALDNLLGKDRIFSSKAVWLHR